MGDLYKTGRGRVSNIYFMAGIGFGVPPRPGFGTCMGNYKKC